MEEAIEHAIAAELVDEARELIARHWLVAWQANLFTVQRWLAALPPGAVEGDARIALARAWSSLFTGRLDDVLAMVEIAERVAVPGQPPDELGSVTAKAAILRGCVAYMRGDLGRTHALARFALTDAGPAGQAIATMLVGLARLFREDPAEAIEPFEHTRALSESLPQALITALAGLVTVRKDARLAEEAQRLIDERGLAESPAASLAFSALGEVHERAGELDAAQVAYERAAALARRVGWPLDLAHALLLEAGLRRRRKDIAGARTLAREARTVLASCADAGDLPVRLERLERGLQLAVAPAAVATEELSERELAVLRLLSTELSQREIGAELFVSFNTVKSHTRTVFRKLGVATRADAVARGREQGLL